jgi:hypothetical protein
MLYRVIFGFTGAGKGWAETHAMLSNLNNPKDLMPTLSDIASKRVQMLGREYAIVGIRASRYATDAGVRTRGAFLQKQRFANSVTTASAAAEPAEVALLVRGSAQPSLINPEFDANVNQTFLGAPLDVCVDNGGVVDPGKGGLGAAFASWRAAMLAGSLGWLANRTVLNTGLATIAQSVDGTVTLTTVDNTVPPLVQGHKYKARVRDVNAGVSPLNGELVVIAGANKTLVTREVIGLALAQAGGFIRVYQEVQPFVGYGDLVLNLIVGNHKKGRPFGSTPGRARRRVRG